MRTAYAAAGLSLVGLLFALAGFFAEKNTTIAPTAAATPIAAETPAMRSLGTILADYRSPNDLFADPTAAGGEFGASISELRKRAEDDLAYARGQLAFAHSTIERLLSEIVIEGAESVEIGGEIRAARTAEAEWRRAVRGVTKYIAHLDLEIAGNIDQQ